MQIIMTPADRLRFGYTQGLYQVCIYGNMDSSVAITPTEVNTGGRYTALDGTVHTIDIKSKSAFYFTYTNKFLTLASNISVRVEGLTLNTTSNQNPPRAFYKICSSNQVAQCVLSASEQNGTASTMTEIAPTLANAQYS